MSQEIITVGSDVIVGGRWMQVEEIYSQATGEDCTVEDSNHSMFAVDQNGGSHEIDASMVDHVYPTLAFELSPELTKIVNTPLNEYLN